MLLIVLFFVFFIIRERMLQLTYTNSSHETKTVTYPILIVLQMKSFLHKVKQFFDEKSDITYQQQPIIEDWVIAMREFGRDGTGVKCAGLFELDTVMKVDKHQVKQLLYGTGVYLPWRFWKMFVGALDQILELFNLVEKDEFVSVPKKQMYRGEGDCGKYSHFTWKVVNGRGDVVRKSLIPHVTKALAEKEFLSDPEVAKLYGSQKLVFDELKTTPPLAVDYMAMVFSQIILNKVHSRSRVECTACKIGVAGQLDHTGPGMCYSPLNTKLRIHFNKVIDSVKINDLITSFDHLRSLTRTNPMPGYQLARAITKWWNAENVIEFLGQVDFTNDFGKLKPIREVMGQFVNQKK